MTKRVYLGGNIRKEGYSLLVGKKKVHFRIFRGHSYFSKLCL